MTMASGGRAEPGKSGGGGEVSAMLGDRRVRTGLSLDDRLRAGAPASP